YLENKTTALSGVSAAGKSTIASHILKKEIQVGDISEKTRRGRHTTRHTELLFGENETYLFDTPGFSSLDLDMKADDLKDRFREFKEFQNNCQFKDCKHINEPKCGIKDAVSEDEIPITRYNNYLSIYNELKEKEKY